MELIASLGVGVCVLLLGRGLIAHLRRHGLEAREDRARVLRFRKEYADPVEVPHPMGKAPGRARSAEGAYRKVVTER